MAGVVVTFLSAFVAYEGVLWAVSRMVGGASGAFTTGILAQVFVLNGATFGALMLVGALLLPVAALVLAKVDDRSGVPLRHDLLDALRGGAAPEAPPGAPQRVVTASKARRLAYGIDVTFPDGKTLPFGAAK